jgi:hypothetical protein
MFSRVMWFVVDNAPQRIAKAVHDAMQDAAYEYECWGYRSTNREVVAMAYRNLVPRYDPFTGERR